MNENQLVNHLSLWGSFRLSRLLIVIIRILARLVSRPIINTAFIILLIDLLLGI